MQIKAGTVYIDVEFTGVEAAKAKLAAKLRGSGVDVAKKFSDDFNKTASDRIADNKQNFFSRLLSGSKKAGSESGSSFLSSFAQRMRDFNTVAGTYVTAGLVAAAVSAAPLVLSALGGALIAGLGAGIICVGILGATKDPKVQKAGAYLADTLMKGFQEASKPFIGPVLHSINMIGAAFLSWLPTIKQIMSNLAPFVTVLTKGFLGAINGILPGLKSISEKAGPLLIALSDGLAQLGKDIGDMLTQLVSDPEAMKGFVEGLTDIFKVAGFLIKELGNLIQYNAFLYAKIKEAWGAIKSFFSGTVVPFFSSSFEKIKGFIRTLGAVFSAFYGNYIAPFVSRVSSGINTVVNFVKGLPGKIIGALSGLTNSLFNLGSNAMQGFLNGLTSVGSRAIQKAKDIAASVKNVVAGILGIHSPSTVFRGYGQNVIRGFMLGLSDMQPQLHTSLAGFGSMPMFDGQYGSPREPLHDNSSGSGVTLNQEFNNVNLDYHKMNEDLAFMVRARGGLG